MISWSEIIRVIDLQSQVPGTDFRPKMHDTKYSITVYIFD